MGEMAIKGHFSLIIRLFSVISNTLVGRVLPHCRDAVSVFSSPSRLGHWDTRWDSDTPLQRCSRRILLPKPIRPLGHSLGQSYSSAEMQSVYSAAPASWWNIYRCRKRTRQPESKSWTRLFVFHVALIYLGKVGIQLLSLQLQVNRRVDWTL